MLLEVAYKIIQKIVHSLLVPIAEKLDHESQSGFRADAAFIVKLAMKKRTEYCNETWIIFS